jgi:hypothetical protein
MSIVRLGFELAPGGSGRKRFFRIIIDGREYVTGCFLAEDLANLARRYPELASEGKRFDLFFSNAGPFSVSVFRRGGELYLRISDSFDGGVLEDGVGFDELRSALLGLMEAVARLPSTEARSRSDIESGMAGLRAWAGPFTEG